MSTVQLPNNLSIRMIVDVDTTAVAGPSDAVDTVNTRFATLGLCCCSGLGTVQLPKTCPFAR